MNCELCESIALYMAYDIYEKRNKGFCRKHKGEAIRLAAVHQQRRSARGEDAYDRVRKIAEGAVRKGIKWMK